MTSWRNPFMQQALVLAETAAAAGEVPVGAVIVEDATGTILAAMHNETIVRSDPTAHAEMLAIRAACAALASNYLTGCTLYVTLEPCPMCAQAIAFSRVGRLVYGASDPKGGGVEYGPQIFRQPTCHHAPEIMSGIGQEEAAVLLQRFFQARR